MPSSPVACLDEFVRRDKSAQGRGTQPRSRSRRSDGAPTGCGGASSVAQSSLALTPCQKHKTGRRQQSEREGRGGRETEVGEVTDLLVSLSRSPTADRAAMTADPKQSAARMCAKVRAATVRSCVRAWTPLCGGGGGTGHQGLPSNPEAVLAYLEQRAGEPCAPSVLRRSRAALPSYEEAAGLTFTQRASKCP